MSALLITEINNRYYLFCGASDIQNDEEESGIAFAVSKTDGISHE